MEATEWRHLPWPGGLLDQPDWWLSDMRVIAWRRNRIKEMQKMPGARAEKQRGWVKKRLLQEERT